MAAGCGGGIAAIPAGGMGDPSSVGQPHCSFQPFVAAGRFAWLVTAAVGGELGGSEGEEETARM